MHYITIKRLYIEILKLRLDPEERVETCCSFSVLFVKTLYSNIVHLLAYY